MLKKSHDFTTWIRPGQTLTGPEGEKWEAALTEKLAKVSDLLADTLTQKQKIVDNPKLTAQGKAEPLQKIQEKALNDLQRMVPEPEKFDQFRADWKTKLQEPAADRQDVAAQVRLEGIRSRLYALDVSDRLKIYVSAIENDDLETVEAIETAPKSFPIVNAKEIERFRKMRLEKKFPDVVAALTDLDNYQNILSGAVKMATSKIQE